MRRLIAFLVLLSVTALASADVPASGNGWGEFKNAPGWKFLYSNHKLEAAYNPGTDEFRTWLPTYNEWSAPKDAPWGRRVKNPPIPNYGIGTPTRPTGDLPKPAVKESSELGHLPAPVTPKPSPPIENYGVVSDKIAGDRGTGYSINGAMVPRDTALAAVAADGLKDDSGKPWLTIIGSEPERKQVLADLDQPPLKTWKDVCHIQAYPPGHPIVKQRKLVDTGHPTIYMQLPKGDVLWRQDNYTGGAATLAAALAQVYNPEKDPGPHNKTPSFPGNVPTWVGGGIGLLVLLVLSRKGGPVQPVQRVGLRRPTPPQGGSAMLPAPPVQSRPEIKVEAPSLGDLISKEVNRKRAEDEELKRRQDERDAQQQALHELLGLRPPAPVVVATPKPETPK